MTSPCALRRMISRPGRWARSRAASWRHSQPNSKVITTTAPTTASQMRRYRRRVSGVAISVLLAGEDIAHAAHGEDALGRFHIGLNRRPDAPHVHIDRAVKSLQLAPPHHFHDLVAREHAPGTFGQ